MRKFLALFAAVLFFSVAVAAQDNSTAPATTSSASAAASPARYGGSDLNRWEIAINYAYVRFRPSSSASFNLHGFNTSVTRYANDWFGLEADVGGSFGHTPATGGPGPFIVGNLRAKLLTYGGGPHIAYRRHNKVQPWGHVLFGGAHFRFPQTGPPSANFAKINAFSLVTGAGLDVKLGPHLAWRVQGDFLGTRFFSTWQKSAQMQAGFVISF